MERDYTSKPIAEDWEPSSTLQSWFFDKFKQATMEDLNYEHEQFVDYYLAKGNRKNNWDAAFRFWCRCSFKLGNKTQKARHDSKPARVSASNADAVGDYLDRYNSESNIRSITRTKGS